MPVEQPGTSSEPSGLPMHGRPAGAARRGNGPTRKKKAFSPQVVKGLLGIMEKEKENLARPERGRCSRSGYGNPT